MVLWIFRRQVAYGFIWLLDQDWWVLYTILSLPFLCDAWHSYDMAATVRSFSTWDRWQGHDQQGTPTLSHVAIVYSAHKKSLETLALFPIESYNKAVLLFWVLGKKMHQIVANIILSQYLQLELTLLGRKGILTSIILDMGHNFKKVWGHLLPLYLTLFLQNIGGLVV